MNITADEARTILAAFDRGVPACPNLAEFQRLFQVLAKLSAIVNGTVVPDEKEKEMK